MLAAFAYEGQRAEDLSFAENVILLVNPAKDDASDWWYGTLESSGRSGFVPRSYLDKIEGKFADEESLVFPFKTDDRSFVLVFKLARLPPCTRTRQLLTRNFRSRKARLFLSSMLQTPVGGKPSAMARSVSCRRLTLSSVSNRKTNSPPLSTNSFCRARPLPRNPSLFSSRSLSAQFKNRVSYTPAARLQVQARQSLILVRMSSTFRLLELLLFPRAQATQLYRLQSLTSHHRLLMIVTTTTVMMIKVTRIQKSSPHQSRTRKSEKLSD